ncbi:MAG: hypothetical protein PW735_02920 [Acidobacteriaceae bacterium]|nr:hypothetical protein [Acidobacteriaceae bacterium]
MKLTAKPVRGSGVRHKPLAATTAPGYKNPNRQIVVRDTGAASRLRDRQSVYELRCDACGLRYGCNGMDIKARLCPGCQGGVAAEPLRESQQSSLFG